MIQRPPAFEAYVDRARAGKLGLWRFVFGLVLIVIASTAAFIVIFVVWSIVIAIPIAMESGVAPSQAEIQSAVESVLYGQSPGSITLLLAAWAGMWVGVWMAAQWLQGRRLASVISARAGLFWPDFLRAAVAMLIGGGVVALVSLLLGVEVPARSPLELGRWLVWLLPVAAATLVQTSAEELVFRGYMTQTLAARFRSPWIWAGIPIAAFFAIHFSSSFAMPTNFTLVGFAAVFGIVTTLLLRHTGSLGAGMGMHFVNNFIAFTIIGGDEVFGGDALFFVTPILDWQRAWFGLASSILPLGIAMLLLFEPRSPLRLRDRDFSEPAD